MKQLVDKLRKVHVLAPEEYRALLTMRDSHVVDYLTRQAREVAQQQFGTGIYLRGLIELSNACRNDCLYCGIRRSNSKVPRYTLTRDQIMDSCEQGYRIGFRTFVLQGGEWSEERSLDWDLLGDERNRDLKEYVKKLLHLYRDTPAVYTRDRDFLTFEWINADDAYRSIFCFISRFSHWVRLTWTIRWF